MMVLISEASGSRSASVPLDARSAAVRSADLPVGTRSTPGGGGGRFHVWELAETGTPEGLQTLATEFTPAQS